MKLPAPRRTPTGPRWPNRWRLGSLETMLEDAAALTGTPELDFARRAVLVLCADNGVVAQGVSQTDASVTRAVLQNLAARRTSVCRWQLPPLQRCAVDMGIAGAPVPGVQDCRIAPGTKDFTCGPAMTAPRPCRPSAAALRWCTDKSSREFNC